MIVENNDLNVTKEVDVDEEIANINATPKLSRSQPERLSASAKKDPDFVRSLKSQGYEESGSKSKLVYDFKESPVTKPTILSSPTKSAAEPRPSSPHKPHPLQFVSPQVNRAMSPSKNNTPPVRSNSPAKNMVERPVSPHKPHPLQFVSPQVNKAIGKSPQVNTTPTKRCASPVRNVPPPPAPPLSEPPSKPAR